jgi:transcriptional regulator with XRE-family HTH domain
MRRYKGMATMLEHLRETAHLTQRDLARRAGITQETLSQLETGKSARPRLDTLTKLRDALELGDMRPGDLLDPRPLDADTELAPAATRLITLLKVLPTYGRRTRGYSNRFWSEFSEHLGYRDTYPGSSLSHALDAAIENHGREPAAQLAQYTLMFFDPDDEGTLRILDDHAGIGPGIPITRRWCRDVTDAAWIIHRAAMTSYPEQVGALYAEANETDNPQRLKELCASVYDIVRSRAFIRATAAEQINALRTDPSSEVHYTVAKNASPEVQTVAAEHPGSWVGLAANQKLTPQIADTLVTTVLTDLTHPDHHRARCAGRALFELAERTDLPRPLLDRISDTIDRTDYPDVDGDRIIHSVLAIRRTLHTLDGLDESAEQEAHTRRAAFRVVDDDTIKTPWWRRFLSND